MFTEGDKNGPATKEKEPDTPTGTSTQPAQSSGFFKRLEFLTPIRDQVCMVINYVHRVHDDIVLVTNSLCEIKATTLLVKLDQVYADHRLNVL